jgi:hypothetical protein
VTKRLAWRSADDNIYTATRQARCPKYILRADLKDVFTENRGIAKVVVSLTVLAFLLIYSERARGKVVFFYANSNVKSSGLEPQVHASGSRK